MPRSSLTTDYSVSYRKPSRLQIAANRRNALRSTGPRTAAGKRRAALNSATGQQLLPPALAAQLRARGEDPREFCRLHRDLIALFRPRDAAGAQAIQLLAETWWEKARRIRQWVAAGPPRLHDLDARLEKLLLFAVGLQRQRHERWQVRLASVLGWPVGAPADVRQRIESRLYLFGAKRWARRYPELPNRPFSREEVEGALKELLATEARLGGSRPASGATENSVKATLRVGGAKAKPI